MSCSPPAGRVGSGRGPALAARFRLPPVPPLAVPACGSMAGVQECLLQLHRCLQPDDAAGAALHGYSLLRSLGETCLTSLAGGAQGAPSGPARPRGWRRGLEGGDWGALRGAERSLERLVPGWCL